MNLHYLTHFHRPSMPHAKAMIASIRRFDRDSPVTCIVDPDAYGVFAESEFVEKMGSILPVSVHVVENECAALGLRWGSVRGKRNPRDVAWTYQACLPFWIMQRTDADFLVYLDSDCFLFQPFTPVIESISDDVHVVAANHFFPPGKENISAGKWNNGTMAWRNSAIASEHAFRWGRESIARWEPHEQKLLDEWHDQIGIAFGEFPPTVGRGPWSLLEIDGDPPRLDSGELLVSFHYHEMKQGTGRNPIEINGVPFNMTNYPLQKKTRDSLYRQYAEALRAYV